jgi:hypothetical protein
MTLLPKLQRKAYDLTPEEAYELDHLRDVSGVAFPFWRRVASRCDVDPGTIISVTGNRYKFTALPICHGKWWCWPSPLECQKPKDIEDMPRWMKSLARA